MNEAVYPVSDEVEDTNEATIQIDDALVSTFSDCSLVLVGGSRLYSLVLVQCSDKNGMFLSQAGKCTNVPNAKEQSRDCVKNIMFPQCLLRKMSRFLVRFSQSTKSCKEEKSVSFLFTPQFSNSNHFYSIERDAYVPSSSKPQPNANPLLT